MRWGKTGALALCITALATAGAQAATVTLDQVGGDTVVRYVAAAGEVNRPAMAYDALTGTVRITDGTTTLSTGATPAELGTCVGGVAAVVCTPEPYLAGAVIRLGDRDDAYTQDVARADVDGGAGNDVLAGSAGTFAGGDGDDDLTGVNFAGIGAPESSRVFAHGGAGDDSFRGTATGHGFGGRLTAEGGPGDDVLLASNHDDLWTGGTGADESRGLATVSYAGHPAAVTVTLDGLANDGAAGEGDAVLETRDVIGSSFADTLETGADDAWLRGGPGDDTLRGGAGPDWLHGEGGDDTLDGGANGDHVDGGDGADDVTGGSGEDIIGAGETFYPGASDVLRAVDGEPDRIYACGIGADTAYADSFDVFDLYGVTCTKL